MSQELARISLTAFLLGAFLGVSCALFFTVAFKQLPVYLASVALFHFLEFYCTAKYSPDKVTTDSFLLFNGSEYMVAHAASITEALLEYYFFPKWKVSHTHLFHAGATLVGLGQLVRSIAMATARESFSHSIATEKKQNHRLVTTGVYGYFRHPSYAGFFYWALGTQVLLCNPFSFIAFYFMLQRFFSRRIRYEESTLIQFFGPAYLEYMKKTRVWIPI
ncbi:hypothetical protein OGATHE_001945 [Ogataea polymorpha]|uniref:Protein-S-isoprenylcysteine O-methyltransferase n=1 Tax=Ogataea polymorpha TaxID=460523 RepID=A0A9P8PM00_9ASCO|nr:hypothetical protein OGATHE_001945 [Ogataea polymorpha]